MNYKITVLPGDGIGPEVVKQAIKVLDAVAKKYAHQFDFKYGLVGGKAIDETGNPYPKETHELCLDSDAILFGAVGDPKYDNDPNAPVRPEQGLLKMRKDLGLFANIRPIFSFDSLIQKSPLKESIVKGVDFVVYRELTSGIYFGKRGKSEDGSEAYDTCYYHAKEIERLVKMGFKKAQERKKKLTLVDKANVLATSRLWRNITQKVSKSYPDISVEYLFVDNAAMQIITHPKQFDVVVTENMFGDILTDEASVITGSLGILPSASVGESVKLFEPIHGSYPQAAGKNIANPVGTILSASMLLEYGLGLTQEAQAIQEAVKKSFEQEIVTPDISEKNASSTEEVGTWIAHQVEK